MDFLEITVTCGGDAREILIAEIAALGFDSMIENDAGFQAYSSSSDYPESTLKELQIKYQYSFPFSFTESLIAKKNWNKEWEKRFQPVWIEKCHIRASFHPSEPEALVELIIDPKMSFGTGHHETTSLMVATMMELDVLNKRVLDCGFGTGVLSILAKKLGASKITGTEIDSWCVENANENATLNGIEDISFENCVVGQMKDSDNFDIIFANINKNVLLEEIPVYAEKLATNGTLVLSGFYVSDLAVLKTLSEASGLEFVSSKEKNNWIAAIFRRLH